MNFCSSQNRASKTCFSFKTLEIIFNYSVRDDPFPYNSTLSNSISWNSFTATKKWPIFGVGGVRDGLSSLKNLKS